MDPKEEAKWYQEDRVDQPEEPQAEKETPSVPPAEEKTDEKETPPSAEAQKEDEQKDDKPLPFHKDPRFKALIDEKNQLKQTVEELKQFKESLQNQSQEQETKEIPSWFQSVYGDDPALYSQYQQANAAERQAIKQEIINEIKAEQNSKSVEEQQINKYIEDQVTTLKEEGNQFDKNELMKVVLDNKLFDDEGRLNFRAGLAILKSTGSVSKTQQAKKDVAGKTDTTPKSPEKKDFVTSKDLRGKSWRDFTN